MTTLFVAAGGGGDAIAATIIHAAVSGPNAGPAVVATYAWDRLLVDPLPGPRGIESFTGLDQAGPGTFLVTERTRPVAPAGSTLPRLASAMPTRLLLLDPHTGGRGLAAQLHAAVSVFDIDQVAVVDVGGDVVARGDEPGVKSPLADALVLAACADLPVPAQVMVAGVGLDGELPADKVRARLQTVGGDVDTVLAPRDVAGVPGLHTVFEWHPSEATAMLVASISGARGIVEVRDAGMQIVLDDACHQVWRCPAPELAAGSLLAPRLAGTATLAQAEDVVRDVCGFCEIDYERAKAARLAGASPEPVNLAAVQARVNAFSTGCARRGADYVTFRRLAEATRFTGSDYERVRAHLVQQRPQADAVPLWPVRDRPAR